MSQDPAAVEVESLGNSASFVTSAAQFLLDPDDGLLLRRTTGRLPLMDSSYLNPSTSLCLGSTTTAKAILESKRPLLSSVSASSGSLLALSATKSLPSFAVVLCVPEPRCRVTKLELLEPFLLALRRSTSPPPMSIKLVGLLLKVTKTLSASRVT
ncbi:hypothetical protein AB1Y20_007883 [Prymnesium parvum]|uniref:Proteasome assembly chaperone 1 n=1 Tax=Prymnesium parvum TaxID=97485 RepID=A0AB34IV00_PRYPA